MSKIHYFFFVILFCSAFAKAQSQATTSDSLVVKRKTYHATRVTTAPNIDGSPFEGFWDNIPVGNNFIMTEPTNGLKERDSHKTEFKIAYDDNALYVAGFLYDNDAQNIARQFSQRDDVNAQADLFGFFINTYNNQINQTRFYATSANALGDAIAEGDSEDFSYNVVFQSETSINERGWYVEMKIPYRTLRFPEVNIQNWSFQIFRKIRSINEEYTYNFLDITKGVGTQYDALLTGVENINPPLRLNLYPYASIIHDNFDGNSTTEYSAGMDLKYGINDAFTLDATLIPDFGQVAFDQVRLNLGPFEQAFGENRAFFNEGTDLFNKGGIFFSRRIGKRPSGSGNLNLQEDESVVENPSKAQLLNAIKITGRTKGRLGVGFLNAITERTEAIVSNDLDGTTRTVVTEALTNYNMLVLDQQFSANSSISLANASTIRNGGFTDANVTAIVLNHNDKKAANNYGTELKMSNRFTPTGTDTGYQAEATWNRTTGKWRPFLGYYYTGKNWDPNDLGINFETNSSIFAGNLDYVQFTPQGIFNRYELRTRVRHRRQASPDLHLNSQLTFNPFFFTRERLAFGATFDITSRNLNQFESRIPDQIVRYNSSYYTSGFISTDYRKKLALDLSISRFKRFNDLEHSYDFDLSPRYRFSDKFLLIYNFNWDKSDDRLSYVAIDGDQAIMSRRNTHSVENRISGTYNFNNKQALSLSFRNFWSKARFDRDFLELQPDGTSEESDYALEEDVNPDANFNVWNLDLSYSWRFAPGSEATLLYRNSIFNQNDQGTISYQESLDDLLKQPTRNNLSLRVTYFLDFNNTKKWFKA